MRTRITMLAAVLALLAGCATSGNGSYPSAFPGDESVTAERECTQNGGMWRENLGICEWPSE